MGKVTRIVLSFVLIAFPRHTGGSFFKKKKKKGRGGKESTQVGEKRLRGISFPWKGPGGPCVYCTAQYSRSLGREVSIQ